MTSDWLRCILVILLNIAKVFAESKVPQAQCEHGRQKYKHLYENPNKKLIKKIVYEKTSIKKPNLIAIVDSFLPVWLFSRSDAI